MPNKINFVSGLGRMMFSLLLQPELLCKNKSLNSMMVKKYKYQLNTCHTLSTLPISAPFKLTMVLILSISFPSAGSCVTSDTRIIRDIFYDGNPIREKCTIILRIAPTFIR